MVIKRSKLSMIKRELKKQTLKKDKYIALSNLRIYSTWKNIKKSYKNNRFKISAPRWKEEFELPDGSCSISDIQNYFEFISKKHGETTINPSIRICINKIENRIRLKLKQDIISNFYFLKQRDYLEAPKVR